MFTRWIEARLLLPTIAMLAALVVLLGLGTWQLQRKAWKEALIAKIAERVTAQPVPLRDLAPPQVPAMDLEYRHVVVTGRFHSDKERYLYAPAQGGLTWQVLTPLEYAPGKIVWINRGAVPEEFKAPETRATGQSEGEVRVTGLVREPKSGAFTPSNDVGRNIWYWASVSELTASAFPRGVEALPFVVEADASMTPAGGLPKAGVTRLSIPNRHLEYAVTWFGLALTLIGVFAAFAWTRLSRDSERTA